MNATIERRAAKIPPKYRKLYLKVLEGQASPRQAVKIMCYECQGWEGDKVVGLSLSQAVSRCPSPACPLWQYRPQARA